MLQASATRARPVAGGRLPLALACALVAGLLLADPGRSATCGDADYSYAGVVDARRAHGIGATLTALSTPHVQSGHVGAWVGVGGVGAGPNGETEWIQVGLSAFPGGGNRLYFEIARPGSAPRYFEVDPDVALGERRRVAVLETRRRRAWWRVWVDGEPVSKPVYLPGSHRAWQPMAMAESWNGGTRACNGFRYRFARVATSVRPGGTWRPLDVGYRLEDPGYVVQAEREGFVARARW